MKEVEAETDEERRDELNRMFQSLSDDDKETVMMLIEILKRRATSATA